MILVRVVLFCVCHVTVGCVCWVGGVLFRILVFFARCVVAPAGEIHFQKSNFFARCGVAPAGEIHFQKSHFLCIPPGVPDIRGIYIPRPASPTYGEYIYPARRPRHTGVRDSPLGLVTLVFTCVRSFFLQFALRDHSQHLKRVGLRPTPD